ncbi:YgeY family selenium metabolism-linked hydrolase [Sporolactobacillus spathodeae]|uniref:Selenium metabolism hydrolase n=1 Tax=Sporolactobacillus spathodeae TaxID=1465502 RepID=A0ABS2Q8A9_9BACL|nr:YgeY family selenium metabolism-linked hydrolase [Sporolactobacillus spathodeae]MBM7658028.1 putative selenium metabolism hydrolase [Sporolactobacillus spathodeae]
MLSDQEKTRVVSLCMKLVNKQSYSGKEQQAAEVIHTLADPQVFDRINVDVFGNVLLEIDGNRAGQTVLLDGHIDTVPVNPANWATDPFAAVQKDGKIFGRGTSDMKGSVSAMIVAAEKYARETRKKFPGKIVIACSVHEETFEGVSCRKISARIDPDVVVIGEATNLNLNRGQRGRAEIVVETYGKSVHSANPEKGVNAVVQMMKLLTAIEQLPVTEDAFMGKGILVLTDIVSAPYPGKSVLPSSCRATFDRRTLVGETKTSVLEPIQRLIEQLKREDMNFAATVSYAKGTDVCYTGEIIEAERFFPAWAFDPGDNFVTGPLRALQSIGIPAKMSHYSFCTNGSHFAGEAGIPTIGFGPSRENLAHTDNEFIEIDHLHKAVEGFAVIIGSLLMND